MKKDMMIFSVVTAVALTAATAGHMWYPPFCMVFKPMSWPFLALGAMTLRRLWKNRGK